jgi:excisionase family DNA binding protein
MTTGTHRHHQPGTTPRRLDGPLLRPDQAASLLAVKTSWVYDAVGTGTLPCICVGRRIRFTQAMPEEHIRSLPRCLLPGRIRRRPLADHDGTVQLV